MQEFSKRTFLKILGSIVAVLGAGFPRGFSPSTVNAVESVSVHMQARLIDLDAMVRRVRDIQEIRRLQYRYISGVFFGNWQEATACFAKKCRFEGGALMGIKEVGNRLRADGAKENIHLQGGFAAHPKIDVDGDKARGSWLLYRLIPYSLTGQLMFYRQQRYDVEYIRESGEWKIFVIESSDRLGPTPS